MGEGSGRVLLWVRGQEVRGQGGTGMGEGSGGEGSGRVLVWVRGQRGYCYG